MSEAMVPSYTSLYMSILCLHIKLSVCVHVVVGTLHFWNRAADVMNVILLSRPGQFFFFFYVCLFTLINLIFFKDEFIVD